MYRDVKILAIHSLHRMSNCIPRTFDRKGRGKDRVGREGRCQQNRHSFLTIMVDTVDCQLRGISGCTGGIGGNASVSARVTRIRRIYGQQAVPLGSGHRYSMTLLDRHSIQRPRDL